MFVNWLPTETDRKNRTIVFPSVIFYSLYRELVSDQTSLLQYVNGAVAVTVLRDMKYGDINNAPKQSLMPKIKTSRLCNKYIKFSSDVSVVVEPKNHQKKSVLVFR